MTPRRKRMATVIVILVGMAVAAGLILTAFEKNLMYFYSPSEVASGEVPTARKFRIGGMVVEGSVDRDQQSLEVKFDLTDMVNVVTVAYEGILPDLFREGQGIVANGRLDKNGVFTAEEVLAKHDENYMPPEVAQALETAKGYTKQVPN